MNEDIRSKFDEVVDVKMRELCEETRRKLVSYIEYEFTIANMELASRQKSHGDDFKTLPHEMVEQIRTQVVRAGNIYTVSISIGQESLKGVSERGINFFKEFVLENAKQRLAYGVK